MARRRLSPAVSASWTAGVMGLCVVVAGGLTWSTYALVSSYEALLDDTVVSGIEVTEDVVFVRRTLGRGTTITAEDIDVRPFGADFVPGSVARDPAALIGRVVRERIIEGDMVREERLAAPDSGQGLTATISPGLRAISLDLHDEERVSGFVEPGDRVDVVVTLPETEGREAETRTVMHAVDVLAVEARLSETAEGDELHADHITLAVTPEQAERLTHVQVEAIPRLVLRAEIDFASPATPGVTSSDLVGRADQRLSVSEYHDQVDVDRYHRMIELYHGRERVVEVYEADAELLAAVLAD